MPLGPLSLSRTIICGEDCGAKTDTVSVLSVFCYQLLSDFHYDLLWPLPQVWVVDWWQWVGSILLLAVFCLKYADFLARKTSSLCNWKWFISAKSWCHKLTTLLLFSSDFLPRHSLLLSNLYCVSPVAFNLSGHYLPDIFVCDSKIDVRLKKDDYKWPCIHQFTP